MALFETRKDRRIKWLEHENKELSKETLDLTQQICNLRTEVYAKGVELEEKICSECDLSPVQIAKVKLLFSIERARLAGVPEDRICHNIDEITTFFAAGEP